MFVELVAQSLPLSGSVLKMVIDVFTDVGWNICLSLSKWGSLIWMQLHIDVINLSPEAGPHWHHLYINWLRPSDAKWLHRSGSTLVQVLAFCLMAPSHYLKQCWLIKIRSSDIHLRVLIHQFIHCWPRYLSPYDVTRPQWVKWVSPWSFVAEKWPAIILRCFI